MVLLLDEVDALVGDTLISLLRMTAGQGLTVANPIYREVLPRALAFVTQLITYQFLITT